MWTIISNLITSENTKDYIKAKNHYLKNITKLNKITNEQKQKYQEYAIEIIEQYISYYTNYLNAYDNNYNNRIEILEKPQNFNISRIKLYNEEDQAAKSSLYDLKSIYKLPDNYNYNMRHNHNKQEQVIDESKTYKFDKNKGIYVENYCNNCFSCNNKL